MKKYVLLLIVFLFSTLVSLGQTLTPILIGNQGGDAFRKQMDILFGQLDHQRVPHGILLDFAMEFTNVPAFNGTLTDSTVINMTVFRQIYNTLLMGVINEEPSSFLVAPEVFEEALREVRRAENKTNFRTSSNNKQSEEEEDEEDNEIKNARTIVLLGLYVKYSRFADNALDTDKLTYTEYKGDSVLLDKYVNGVWQNPYGKGSHETFAMTPPITEYDGTTLKVKLSSKLFFSNNLKGIRKIEVDFDNGEGYVTTPFDKEILVKYKSGGTKNWKYRAFMIGGAEYLLQAESKIKIKKMFEAIPWEDRFIH